MDRMSDWITTGERPLPFFVTAFAKSASGGKAKDDDGDDDDGDDDDDSDDDDDDDEEDDDLADMTDEELREALKEERAKAARQSDRNARRRKREKKAREEASKAKPAAAKSKAKDDDEDAETARENGRREGEAAGITRAKKAEAKSSLLAAGVNPARVARAVGLLDLDDLDLDDEGLDGIDEAIDDLRKEWPELFAKKRTRRGSVAGEGDRSGDKGARRKEMTPSERQAALATGRSRR